VCMLVWSINYPKRAYLVLDCISMATPTANRTAIENPIAIGLDTSPAPAAAMLMTGSHGDDLLAAGKVFRKSRNVFWSMPQSSSTGA
jgi:hypothetical protein